MKSLGIGTHWTFFGNNDRIKLNRPKPKAVPDSIKSSIGPSWVISDGNVGTDKVAVPSHREKKPLPVGEDTAGETLAKLLEEIVERDGSDEEDILWDSSKRDCASEGNGVVTLRREKEFGNPAVSGNP